MEELRMALWSRLEDIDHSLEALEAVTRALCAAGSLDRKDMDNVMWHIGETIQNIRANLDDSTAMVMQMKVSAA